MILFYTLSASTLNGYCAPSAAQRDMRSIVMERRGEERRQRIIIAEGGATKILRRV
jgi:hypothetical protein